MSHIHIAELIASHALALYVGYRYAKSKFAAGISTVVSDVKKL